MKYKPFIEVNTFNDFKTLKLSVDNTDSIYTTYENDAQTFGTPDVLYGQFVFIKDSGIIYLKGHFFTDKEFILSSEYEVSKLERENLLLQSGDTFEEAFGKIEKTIVDNELSLAYALNDLNDKISYSGKGLVLSSEYEVSKLERENLLLQSGDTFEQAFGKIEKTIIDNELSLAYALNDLNIKVNDIKQKTLGLPNITSSDNGKILMVVNGEWQLTTPTIVYNGTELPNNSNGNNGDLYIQTNE